MAERIEPIEVTIQYEYIDDNLKKAVKDIKSFETTVSSDVGTITKNFNGLKDVYSAVQKSISADNPKIARSMQQVDKAMDNASVSFQKFENSVQNARNALNTIQGLKRTILSQERTISPEGIVFNKNKSVNKTLTEQYTAALAASNEANNEAMTARLRYAQSVKSVASAEQNLIATQNNLNKSTKEAEAATKSLNNRVKGLRQAIRGIRFTSLLQLGSVLTRLGRAMLNFVEQSSSWIENLNLLENVFAENTDAALDFIDATADNFGLDANALAEYIATFRQMANAMGQTTEAATQMSEALTRIALDVASLRNVEFDTVISDFTSALAGQVKPVRKYGFDITMYSIDELMEELGYGSVSRTMSQGDKQLARAILLIRQSQDAWGDLSITINTFANQQRMLNDQWNTALRLLGNVALGTFNVTDSFDTAWQSAGLATKAIWTLNGAMLALNQVLSVIVPNTQSIGAGAIATEAEIATDAIEEMDEATTGALADFDKFNVLNQGSGGSNLAVTSALEALLNNEYAKYMTEYNKQLENINMYAKEISATIFDFLLPGYKEWYNAQKTIGEDTSLSAYLKEQGITAEEFSNQIGDIGKSFLGLAELVLAIASPFAFLISQVVLFATQNQDFLRTLVGLGQQVGEFMSRIGETFANLIITLSPLLEITLKIAGGILDIVNAVDGANLALYALISILAIIKGIKIAKGIKEIITAVKALNVSTATLQKTLAAAGIITFAVILGDLIANWDNLSTAGKALRIVILAILVAITLFNASSIKARLTIATLGKTMRTYANTLTYVRQQQSAVATGSNQMSAALMSSNNTVATANKSMSNMFSTIMAVVAAVSTLAMGIANYVSGLNSMSTAAKVLIPIIAVLAAVFTGLAVAKAAASAGIAAPVWAGITAAAIAAGIVLAAGTAIATAKFADGGYTKGNLFYAGESGPEWVGRQGNTSTIMNDTQMSDIMRRSVAEGVAIGNAGSYNNRRESRQPIILQVNGKKFLEIVEDEGKKVGKTMARVR